MTKTEMQLPDKPTIMYLRQLLVAAIYVIAGPDNRPVILGTGLDLGDALSTFAGSARKCRRRCDGRGGPPRTKLCESSKLQDTILRHC